MNNHIECVRLLVGANADVNAVDEVRVLSGRL